jgi:hypothetical protein
LFSHRSAQRISHNDTPEDILHKTRTQDQNMFLPRYKAHGSRGLCWTKTKTKKPKKTELPILVQRKYLIRIEKPPFSQLRKGKVRLTLLQPATEDSKDGNTKQRTKDQETKNKIKHESSMNKSASLTPIQGQSTVACMIVTSLSQLSHWLRQLPTVGKGQWKH